MAPRKQQPTSKEVIPESLGFESELETSLSLVSAMVAAPEAKIAIKDLKDAIVSLHNRYTAIAVKEAGFDVMELEKNADAMRSDIQLLKNTILRMAVAQYGK